MSMIICAPPPPEGNHLVSTEDDIKPVVFNKRYMKQGSSEEAFGGIVLGIFDGKPDSITTPNAAYEIRGFSGIFKTNLPSGDWRLSGPDPVKITGDMPRYTLDHASTAIESLSKKRFSVQEYENKDPTTRERQEMEGLFELRILQRIYETAAQFNAVHSVNIVKYPELFADIAAKISKVIEAKTNSQCEEILYESPPLRINDVTTLSDGSVIRDIKRGSSGHGL
jgi:hypothetical protein